MVRLLSVASLMLLLLTLPREHRDRASLSGRVTDDKLDHITDATLSIRNVSFGEVDTNGINARGAYAFTHLRQRRYSMFIEAAGYSRGAENLCEAADFAGYTVDGGCAECVVAPEEFVYESPEGIDDVQARRAGIIGFRCLRL